MSRDAAEAAPTPAVPTTPQYFDPLAVMVGEFARDFVDVAERMAAIDRLYVLLREARSTPAEALDVRPESDLLRIPWPQASVTEGLDVERLARAIKSRYGLKESESEVSIFLNAIFGSGEAGHD